MSGAPPPNSPPRGTPAQRVGASRADAVPRMETVRITQPDLQKRGALEKMRNRQILAISLPTVAVFADPRQIIDPAEAAHRLKQVLPRLNEAAAQARLAD